MWFIKQRYANYQCNGFMLENPTANAFIAHFSLSSPIDRGLYGFLVGLSKIGF